MRIAGRDRLLQFFDKHADACEVIKAWQSETETAMWQTPQDIKDRYVSVSVLGKNLVIFNLKGNRYRMACKVNYAAAQVEVVWIGTHAEYSKRKF
ncbi:type II toxin-antitoxin system HigB family toxin [Acidiferrobacter sp.]|uniref:type II toxin-antitoxin system HigB family toxin n=1 Tax=Acidiferrobacter sp. TaxID=1872107 RepID=UPI00343213ED